MDTQDAPPSPSDELANLIVEDLVKEGLIRPEKQDALVKKIAKGTMRSLDWRLEVELPAEDAPGEDDDD